MILAIRTDKPEAELYIYNRDKLMDSYKWLAHRELSDTLLSKINQLLANNSLATNDLTGIVVYQGPGSFTGLRIGITVANTLAYALEIPVVGSSGSKWASVDLRQTSRLHTHQIVMPNYGGEVNITQQKR